MHSDASQAVSGKGKVGYVGCRLSRLMQYHPLISTFKRLSDVTGCNDVSFR